MTKRPNVVFITCDQLRGDALGCYGHPVVETPHLDMLANRGIRFTQAYTAVPSCIAARAGILTGLAQAHHGRVGYRDGIPFNYDCTLPGELARVGYHTQGVGKMHFSPARNLCGFHNVVLHDGYLHCERKAKNNYDLVDDYTPWLRQKLGADADMILHGMNANSWVARPWQYSEDLHPTTWATTMGIDFLRRRDPSKPFFLWLSYVRPHPPLDPPKIYFDQYINQDFPSVPMGDWADKDSVQKTVDANSGYMGKRQLHRARAAYYAQITHIDHQLGRFMEYLIEHEEQNNTWFVFTADHGELLGDHNLFQKTLPYNGSAHVPFIIVPPLGWKGEKGLTSNAAVELRDVMPTILDICGVDIPESLDGRTLLPWLRGETPEWREYVHVEHSGGPHAIITDKWKYIWFHEDGREQFFHTAEDPAELRNLINEPTAREGITWCHQKLVEELADREEGFSDGKQLIAGQEQKPVLDFVTEQNK